MKSFSELKVLIVDDAPVVIASVKGMLRQLGFTVENIFFTKSPKACIYMVSQEDYDIIICDFNFHKDLNGMQIFEELVHYDYLKKDSIFIMITGESNRTVAEAMIELKPDEYILKPFNPAALKKRIISAMKRKTVLSSLYYSELKGEYDKGLAYCDELELDHPAYYYFIQKFRGDFSRRLKKYEEAKVIYENVLSQKKYDWAKLGLANSMVALDKNTQAMKILNDLASSGVDNVVLQMEMGNYYLKNGNVRQALFHLNTARELAPGNSEREIMISNLYISIGEYSLALDRYRNYVRINQGTFRDNKINKINLLRRILLLASQDAPTIALNNKLFSEINTLLGDIVKSDSEIDDFDYKYQIGLLTAHISILKGELDAAMASLKVLYKAKDALHFYDWLHMCWILDILSFDEELKPALLHLKSLLQYETSEYVANSKLKIIKTQDDKLRKRHEWVSDQYMIADRYESERNYRALLSIYLKIREKCPYQRKTSLKIMRLLSETWPLDMSLDDVEVLIYSCNTVIKQLMSKEELKKVEYKATYQSVSGKLSKYKISGIPERL